MAWSVKYDPGVTGSNTPVAPATGAVALSGSPPVLSQGTRLTPSSGVLSMVGAAVALGLGVAPPAGVISVAGQTPAISTSGGATFDYYISPTGSDSNAGTLAAPWALTSLSSNGQPISGPPTAGTNFAKLQGKRVGILPGTYTITASFPAPVTGGEDYAGGWLSLPSGTESNPTYVGGCTSAGYALPRNAQGFITSAPLATIVWGGSAASLYSIFANYPAATDNCAWMTIDGLAMNFGNFGEATNGGGNQIIQFVNQSTVGTSNPTSANITGVVVQNCDLGFMKPDTPGDNYGLIRLEGVWGSIFQNNYFHDVVPTGSEAGPNNGNPSHVAGTVEIGCYGNQFLYNTYYNTPGGHWTKEGNCGTIMAYNYLYWVGAGGVYGTSEYCSPFTGFDDAENTPNVGPAGYLIYQIHHNICDSCVSANINQDTAPGSTQSKYAWNNTVWDTLGGTWRGWMMGCQKNNGDGSTATAEFYNNIYVTSTNSSGSVSAQPGKLNVNSGHFANVNNNCYYAVGGSYTGWWGLASTAYSSFSSWQTAIQASLAGSESASINVDPQFTVGTTNLVAGNGPAQFQLASGSPCLGTGTGGANMGAWDGTVTQIGCSFKQSGPWS